MCKAVRTTDIQTNFGKYLEQVQNGEEIVIIKNGKEVARLISKETASNFLVDSLPGILREAGANA